eukprot:CAMPEP_0197860874 /NCGR_PEP_ID=MMETSP1438-20131217/36540_1 /TAXON_ID=1461541 /ORGANISM="Pterosperma sp., Strain CCMP1384" /LENGTH=272 /DNA_ID=CAMNT_0043477879 /DNA_START=62 /DNA_END=880 /DNA_ORIENTATION=+
MTEDTQYTAQLRSFNSETLQDNWWENRIQKPEEVTHDERLQSTVRREREDGICKFVDFDNCSQPFASVLCRQRHTLPGSKRTIPQQVDELDYTTTYKAMMDGEQNHVAPPATVKLVHETNFYKEVHTSRNHEAKPANGFGGVLPSHPPSHKQTYFETTNQAMYDRIPKEVKAKPPPPEQGNDSRYLGGYAASHNPNNTGKGQVYSDSRSFYYTRQLPRDSLDTFVAEEPPRGRAGARGHLVRVPDESGSKKGTHTWADEYAGTHVGAAKATV